MESFLNRYRNITVLLLVIFAQLVLVAVQVKNDSEVRMIRVWTVTAVTPVARLAEAVRGGVSGVVKHYVLLHDADAENRRLQSELNRLKLENVFLKDELNTADRAKALLMFQSRIPSKTLGATVIGVGPGVNSKMVFVDRGSVSGVRRGMAVISADGIVGKVIGVYPTASEVLLVTDPDFAAGVISQKTQVRGTLKGQGTPLSKVDYVPYEEKLQTGDMFYTSGDDRIFPRGFPVGVVKAVRNTQPYKEVYVEPSGLRHGVEQVLILIEGANMDIPEAPPDNQPVYIAPAAPPAPAPAAPSTPGADAAAQPQQPAPATPADKLKQAYQSVGKAENHTFGEGGPRSKPPDFTKLGMPDAPAAPGAGTAAPAAKQPATSTPASPKTTGKTAPAAGKATPSGAGPQSPAPKAPAPGTGPGPVVPAGAPAR